MISFIDKASPDFDPFKMTPEQALKWFKSKGLKVSFHWDDLWKDEHDRAFTMAKMMDVELLQDVKDALDDALETGETMEEFSKKIMPLMEQKGWIGYQETVDPETGETVTAELGTPRRVELVYRQNLAVAYERGRWEYADEVADELPMMRYDAVMDDRTRDEHAAWNGITLPVDDEFWNTHSPANGWNCRCSLIQLSKEDADKLPGKKDKPEIAYYDWENPRTGEVSRVPVGIDPGWDYNPGRDDGSHAEEALKEREADFFENNNFNELNFSWQDQPREPAGSPQGGEFAGGKTSGGFDVVAAKKVAREKIAAMYANLAKTPPKKIAEKKPQKTEEPENEEEPKKEKSKEEKPKEEQIEKGSPEEAEKRTAKVETDFINEVKGKKTEQSITIDDKGNIVARAKGDTNTVGLTASDVEKIRGAAKDIHNHPGGDSPFSADDISFAQAYGIKEIVVIGKTQKYTLTPADGKTWPDDRTINKHVSFGGIKETPIWSEFKEPYEAARVRGNKKEATKIWEAAQRENLKRSAEKMGLIYKEAPHAKN